jgi:hypothetical protein
MHHAAFRRLLSFDNPVAWKGPPMLKVVRRHLPVAVTAAVVCCLFAGGPSIAKAAADVVNADKVDGKHAVGAGASVAGRKGKLVATDAHGRLPNNIITKAPDAAKLGGEKPGTYRATGHGKEGATTTIDSCGSGVVESYAVHLGRDARIFATAASSYGRSNPGPERPSILIQLLDASSTIVAESGRAVADGTSGNPSLSVAGVLLTMDGSAPYDAAKGDYTLRIFGDNFGSCSGFGQYQQPQLTHIELAAGD